MFRWVSEQSCKFQIYLLKSQICFKGEKKISDSYSGISGGILFIFFKLKIAMTEIVMVSKFSREANKALTFHP